MINIETNELIKVFDPKIKKKNVLRRELIKLTCATNEKYKNIPTN